MVCPIPFITGPEIKENTLKYRYNYSEPKSTPQLLNHM